MTTRENKDSQQTSNARKWLLIAAAINKDLLNKFNKLLILLKNFFDWNSKEGKKHLKLSLGLAILSFILILTVILVGNKKSPKLDYSTKVNALSQEMANADSINNEINTLKSVLQNRDQLTQDDIKQIKERVIALQERSKELFDQQSFKQISDSLAQSNQAVNQKLSTMQSSLDEIKESLQTHTYINPKNLPFTVISVDIWNGVPYATVEIDHQEGLMGVNDSRSGWMVDAIDFGKRLIVFKNSKDQYIKLQLEG